MRRIQIGLGIGSGSGSAVAKPALELVRCVGAPLPPVDTAKDIGMIGTGRYGTIGHGSHGYGPGPNAPTFGQTSVQGDLDKNLIRRYVRRALPQITECYEHQLVGHPDILGKIDAHFVIDGNGKVISSKADGFDPKVAACVALVIAQIEFPKPHGGGSVHVNYPFNFRSAGSDPPPAPAPAPPPPPPPAEHGHKLGTTFDAWTPYALADTVADGGAASAAASTAIGGTLAGLDHCFDGSPTAGSLRAMLAFSNAGAITRVRVGGLGDAAVESCLAAKLRALAIPAQPVALELACDLRRGGDQPWRMTPAAGYTVIAVHKDGVDPAAKPPAKDAVVLVLADADAPPSAIAVAVDMADPAAATLLAVHSGGTPTFAAMRAMTSTLPGEVVDLWEDQGKLVPEMLVSPPDPEPIAQAEHVLAAARAKCPACMAMLALDQLPPAEDLLAIALAARRAGFERVGLRDQAGYGYAHRP